KGVKLSRQSNVAITMTYLGQRLPVKSRDEMKVFQQICGGENICVFKGHLLPGGTFWDSTAPSEENLESGKDTTDESGGRTTEKESCVSSPLFIPVKRSGKKSRRSLQASRRHYQEAVSGSTDEDWHCATETGDCRRQREDVQKKRSEDISAPAGEEACTEQVDDMVTVLEASDLVEQLVLRNTGLTDDLLGRLITAMMNSPSEVEMHSGERKNFTLLELDIGGNKTTSKGLRAVASFLTRHSFLQYLGLAQSNGADTEGWEEVFNSLKTNNSVSHIILDENCLGDEGAKLFAEMLKSNQSLCKVDLDSNGIGERGAHDILEALISRRGCSLEHLSLENNVIGDELLTKIHEQLK
uniref:DUF4590 domain-containing protein n=1 Tax=Lepisosteus oculatus TaxID=7918 RepID=W5M643_LEPOC